MKADEIHKMGVETHQFSEESKANGPSWYMGRVNITRSERRRWEGTWRFPVSGGSALKDRHPDVVRVGVSQHVN